MNHNGPTWEEIFAIVAEAQAHPERLIPLDLDDETPDHKAEG